jgi:hypothetical protein
MRQVPEPVLALNHLPASIFWRQTPLGRAFLFLLPLKSQSPIPVGLWVQWNPSSSPMLPSSSSCLTSPRRLLSLLPSASPLLGLRSPRSIVGPLRLAGEEAAAAGLDTARRVAHQLHPLGAPPALQPGPDQQTRQPPHCALRPAPWPVNAAQETPSPSHRPRPDSVQSYIQGIQANGIAPLRYATLTADRLFRPSTVSVPTCVLCSRTRA